MRLVRALRESEYPVVINEITGCADPSRVGLRAFVGNYEATFYFLVCRDRFIKKRRQSRLAATRAISER